MKGLTVTDNPMGFTAVRLHYSADPEKDPEHPNLEVAERAQKWLSTMRAMWPDPNDWSREMEINFFASAGQRVFPQFTMDRHVVSCEVRPRKVIYRGWDFGWHAPVCLIAQIDPQERLRIVKEVVGSKQSTKEFAQQVLDVCSKAWPFHAAGFHDYCDPHGQDVKSIDSEKSERRDVEVLNGLGIFPSYEWGWSRKDGRSLIHQLLSARTDGTPSLYVDPNECPLLLQAFLGRYVYEDTQDGKVKEEPDDKTHPWADVMAALRYLTTGLRAKLGLGYLRPQAPQAASSDLYPKEMQGYGSIKRRL